MRMSPEIILSGANPNFLQTMGQAAQVAGATNAVRDQNALRSLYQEQGPGIMAGEQGAMNALAQLDPMQAAQFQQNREQSDMARERLSMARQAAARAAETHVAQMDAETRRREAEELDRTLARLATARDPQSWDALAGEVMPEAVGKFGERDMILAQGLGLRDVLEMQKGANEPAAIQSLRIRAKEAGLQPGTPAYEEFMRRGGTIPSTMSLRTNPDGSVEFVQGEGAGVTKPTNTILTEAQRAESAYESIMQGLDAYEEIVQTGGGAILPSKQKDALVSARRDLQLQMKELFNLGVLNGPDLELMNQMIVDATDPINIGIGMIGGETIEERTTASVKQLRDQLTRMVAPKLKSIGRPEPASGGNGGGQTSAPQPGATEDGYRFLGGDPGDPENWQKVE